MVGFTFDALLETFCGSVFMYLEDFAPHPFVTVTSVFHVAGEGIEVELHAGGFPAGIGNGHTDETSPRFRGQKESSTMIYNMTSAVP